MKPSILVQDTIDELSKRWERARLAALKSVSETASELDFFQSLSDLPVDQFEAVLKAVFLNSRKLAQTYQRTFQTSWEPSDFPLFISQLGSLCLGGEWSVTPSSASLVRSGCVGKKRGLRHCQYWREAIDGLTLGISDETGYVRHGCINAGDAACIDVFYEDEVSLTDAIWSNVHKWGVLPQNMRPDLELIERKFSELRVELKFLGISESNLFYKLEPKESLTCGTAGTIYRTRLEKIIQEKFPSVHLRDASPIAVYGEKA